MKAKIGLELHVPLPTKTKLFCRCSTEVTADPNTNVCPICVGFPGTKPKLNFNALTLSIALAKLLDCTINPKISFSRKTYFYPDLPKNFQITQFEAPIGVKGKVTLIDHEKTIQITRLQLEEDPGRIKYSKDGRTLVDYNRAGMPLVEIVTAPDFVQSTEVLEFLEILFATLRYIGIENPEAIVRCDVNVSVAGGARVEVKNVSGINNIKKTLEYEVSKQIKLLKAGLEVQRVTLMFDSERKITLPLRKKEYEEDYGYIFEPDLPQYNIKELPEQINTPPTPVARFFTYITTYDVKDPKEQKKLKKIFFSNKEWGDILERLTKKIPPSKKLHNLLLNLLETNKFDSKTFYAALSEPHTPLVPFIEKAFQDEVTTSVITEQLTNYFITGKLPQLEEISQSDTETETLVTTFFEQHPDILQKVKNNPKMINFAVGQIIKKTGKKHLAKKIKQKIEEIITHK